jgi:TPR repeat protein
MTRIGMLYHDARGVERDPAEAAHWWRRAAVRGDADGQAMLGDALAHGTGVPCDPVAALAWLIRAQAGGSVAAAAFLGPARAALDTDRIAEAERRAAAPLAGLAP